MDMVTKGALAQGVVTAFWDADGEDMGVDERVELRIGAEADHVYIDGLRDGQYICLKLVDLLEAVGTSLAANSRPIAGRR